MSQPQTSLVRFKRQMADFAEDLEALEALLQVDVPSSLNKIRFITEKVLCELCKSSGVSWGQAEPTLERMIGPLVSAGAIPKSVAVHVRTVQVNSSPGSHFQESALSRHHVASAYNALGAVLHWYCELRYGPAQEEPRGAGGESKTATPQRFCPKCRAALVLAQPMPEKVVCASCKAVIKVKVVAKADDALPAATPVLGAVPTATHAVSVVAGYQLQRELARGGLGVVYLAFHPHLKHYRAIKRPLPLAAVDKEVVLGRFRREIEALGSLDSKHIIRAFDAGADADGPYLVTEFLDGESFNALAARHGPLPVAEACELIRQAAVGLQSALEFGLVHRDIKPSNLILARAGAAVPRVVIIDWGIVKRQADDNPASRLTQLHTELGTPDYVAPEQIRDPRSVDCRADIYSLGLTLWFLLAGKPPFDGRSNDAKLLAQATEPLPPLPRGDIPRPLLDVLDRMTRKDPAGRFRTSAEAAAALQPFCAAEPHRLLALLAPVPLARSASQDTPAARVEPTQIDSKGETPGPRSKRRPWLLPLAVVASLLVAVVGIGFIGWQIAASAKKEKVPVLDKNNNVANAPPVDEPFEDQFGDALKELRLLPKGWTCKGPEIAVQRDVTTGLASLQVTVPKGEYFVTAHPPRKTLAGDFSIEGDFRLQPTPYVPAELKLNLSTSQVPVALPIVIRCTWSGAGASIKGDAERPAGKFKQNLTNSFQIIRKKTGAEVSINGESVVTARLGEMVEYETISVGMSAGAGYLYSFKVNPLESAPKVNVLDKKK